MCGLFGWIGKDSQNFNKEAFTILGLYNQDRGTDAVGILTSSSTLKSIKNGKFSKFIQSEVSYVDLIDEDVKFVLGHTRNASPGTTKTIDNAQPVGYLNTKTDRNYGLIHNGNIKNADDILDGLKLESSGLSDSYDMARILFNVKGKKMHEILKTYIGKAALVWVDSKDQNVTYMFRGSSLASSYSKVASEERPLYYFQEDEHSLYFSSLKESLVSIFPDAKEDVINLPVNTLHEFRNGKLIKTILIDRSKALQEESYQAKNYNDYNDYYDNTMGYLPQRSNSTKVWHPDLDKNRLMSHKAFGFVSIKNGHYIYNDEYLNGEYAISRLGLILNTSTNLKDEKDFFKVYFYNGLIIKHYLISKFKHAKSDFDKFFNEGGSKSTYIVKKELSEFVYNPVILPLVTDKVSTASSQGRFFNDKNFSYPFSSLNVSFFNGSLKSINSSNIHPPVEYQVRMAIVGVTNVEELQINGDKLLEENTSKNVESENNEMYSEYLLEMLDLQIMDFTEEIETTREQVKDASTSLSIVSESIKYIDESSNAYLVQDYKKQVKKFSSQLLNIKNILEKIK